MPLNHKPASPWRCCYLLWTVARVSSQHSVLQTPVQAVPAIIVTAWTMKYHGPYSCYQQSHVPPFLSALRRSFLPAQSLFPHLSTVHTQSPAVYYTGQLDSKVERIHKHSLRSRQLMTLLSCLLRMDHVIVKKRILGPSIFSASGIRKYTRSSEVVTHITGLRQQVVKSVLRKEHLIKEVCVILSRRACSVSSPESVNVSPYEASG